MDKNVLVESLEIVNRQLDAKKLPESIQKVMDILGADIGEDRSINDLKEWLKVVKDFKKAMYAAENVHTKYNAVDKMNKLVDDFENAVRAVSDYQMKVQLNDFLIFNAALKQIKSAVPEEWFNAFCNKLNVIGLNSEYSYMYDLPTSIENYINKNENQYFVILDIDNNDYGPLDEIRLDMLETLQKALQELISNRNIDWNIDRSSIQYKD